MGAHQRLAMEVVDDVKLGKLVKAAGLPSGWRRQAARSAFADGIRAWGILFAAQQRIFMRRPVFRLSVTAGQIAGTLLMSCCRGCFTVVHDGARIFAAVAILLPILAQAGAAFGIRRVAFVAVTQPLGALIFVWMIARSTFLTLRTGRDLLAREVLSG